MTQVGVVVHHGRSAASEAARDLEGALSEEGVGFIEVQRPEEAVGGAPLDLVVSVGGDGTFLRAAHVASAVGCPVLGVKVGRLGFLTEVEPNEALDVVRLVLAGKATIEERLAVAAEPEDGVTFEPRWGMNEVTVEKHARHRLVRLAVEVDGEYVTTFSADGVIVATPTGSTAYSFSARGPIVTPAVPCLVLTPIAPHMVFDRSFVLGAQQRVVLEVVGDESGVLSADGRESIEIPIGTRVEIHASDHPARFVRRGEGPQFLARVREKFGLPGDPVRAEAERDG
ncbi:MAG: NAD(+)/NADH kinase [Actinomycetota bacterium]|nr:NAD(+)/NADH kinase [Actinomycetota bacterium]